MELLGFGATGWGTPLLQGAMMTLGLALCTLPFGLLLGLGVAMAKHGGPIWLGIVCGIYTSLCRALPELLTILIVYFLGQSAINTLLAALGLGIQIEVSGFAAGFVALGLVLGLLGSVVAARLLAALLYATSPTDPVTLAATTVLLAAVALLACYVPARRATRIDPLSALRAQ